jgi:hypothetical protein
MVEPGRPALPVANGGPDNPKNFVHPTLLSEIEKRPIRDVYYRNADGQPWAQNQRELSAHAVEMAGVMVAQGRTILGVSVDQGVVPNAELIAAASDADNPEKGSRALTAAQFAARTEAYLLANLMTGRTS